MAQKKGARVSEEPEDLAHVPLQAILLADSFTTKFRPITFERPKVLLPLVNTPMIDYSLAWLESAGVEEVFVFCCAHAKQVIDYLEDSHWLSLPKFTVTTIESNDCISAGDALRFIYDRHVIHGDFVLISGDTVSNMSLTQALQEHKERRKKDSNAVMTMVIKKSKPSLLTHQTRLGTDELFMAIDPHTKQLLYYEENSDNSKGSVVLDKTLIADNPSISLHDDKQDCFIDICSPEVLSLFTDNFDYQHLRRHFVKGLLVDDVGLIHCLHIYLLQIVVIIYLLPIVVIGFTLNEHFVKGILVDDVGLIHCLHIYLLPIVVIGFTLNKHFHLSVCSIYADLTNLVSKYHRMWVWLTLLVILGFICLLLFLLS